MRWDSVEPIRDLNEAPRAPRGRIDPLIAVLWLVVIAVAGLGWFGLLIVVRALFGLGGC